MTTMTEHENDFSPIGQSVAIARHDYRNVRVAASCFWSEIAGYCIPGKICRVKGAEGWNDLPRPLLLTMRAI